jgi:hypothetical protein
MAAQSQFPHSPPAPPISGEEITALLATFAHVRKTKKPQPASITSLYEFKHIDFTPYVQHPSHYHGLLPPAAFKEIILVALSLHRTAWKQSRIDTTEYLRRKALVIKGLLNGEMAKACVQRMLRVQLIDPFKITAVRNCECPYLRTAQDLGVDLKTLKCNDSSCTNPKHNVAK